jgi:hypothetical protein
MDQHLEFCRLAGVLRCGARRWKVLLSVRFVARFVDPLKDKGHWGGGAEPGTAAAARQDPSYPTGGVHDVF